MNENQSHNRDDKVERLLKLKLNNALQSLQVEELWMVQRSMDTRSNNDKSDAL